MKKKILFTTLLLTAVVGIAMLLSSPRDAAAEGDGITFSHAIHKEQVECSTCHSALESDAASDNLLPKPSVCADCHDEADVRGYWSLDESADLATYVRPVKNHKLYFSHKKHAGGFEMTCTECHVGISDDEGEALPSMDICARCHNNADALAPIIRSAANNPKVIPATKQCEACHTTLAGLHPENHRVPSFIQEHGKFAMNGEADRECAVCHSQSFCQECHSPTNDVPLGVGNDRFYIDGWPRGEKMDDERALTVQKAHPLGFAYTHGFDARAKTTRCETCHEQETFCAPCHENGFDATGVRIVPQSHQLAGFVLVGGGKANNRHGKLAETDIESCVTCHNVEGGDPVCAACHSTGAVTGGLR
ncbi:MAG: cytochrome c3 family protein [Bacteroidota bacterium]